MSLPICGGCLNPLYKDEVEGLAFAAADERHPFCPECWEKAEVGRCERCREAFVGSEIRRCGGETLCASCHAISFEEGGGDCECSRLAAYLGRET